MELLQQFHSGRSINPLGPPAIRLRSAGPRERERPLAMVRSHRKRKRARQVDKSRQQVRHDPASFFVANLERLFDEWVSILLTTTLPCGISSSDPCILTAFRLLDSAIDGSESMRSRFAHSPPRKWIYGRGSIVGVLNATLLEEELQPGQDILVVLVDEFGLGRSTERERAMKTYRTE